ncbi:YusW family protein [Halalkalibacterium ligniniphilum]|uniref:YusW family protein n=1 Tax=Halalkalibacterium ligniniphilum TaxID=1134413 RepID=UPI000348C0E6|nr:YusW family protein [Halalkalibacterium ligniniphilum]
MIQIKGIFLFVLVLFLAACGSTETVEEAPLDESESSEVEVLTADERTVVVSDLFKESAESEGTSEEKDATDEGAASHQAEEEQQAKEHQKKEEEENETIANSKEAQKEVEGSSSLLSKGIKKFELELEFMNDEEWEFKYEQDKEKQKAEIEKENGEKQKIEGEEAISSMETLLSNLTFDETTSPQEVQKAIFATLNVDAATISKFELKIEFQNKEKIEVKQEVS